MKWTINALAHRILQLPYEELSRGELLARYQKAGDGRAFETLVRRVKPLVASHCRLFLHNPEEADETAAEVFALLATKAHTIRDPAKVDSWLLRAAFHVSKNHNRRNARRRALERPLAPYDRERPELAAGPRPDVEAELREQYQQVLAEMQGLSETLRRTLDVVQQTDSYRDAAEVLGCSLAKVKQDVSRAHRTLRERLRAKGIVLPAALAAVLFGSRAAAARWPTLRAVVWGVLAFAGVGLVLLASSLWGGSRPPPPDTALAANQPALPAPETLQEKNLRIFRNEVQPKLTANLRGLAGGEVRVVEARAEGAEVICRLEGPQSLPGFPRVRARYCVLTRTLYAELDAWGTGEWKMADPDRIRTLPGMFGKQWGLEVPLDQLGIREAFALLPPDERALDEVNELLRSQQAGAADLLLPATGWWGIAGNTRDLYLRTDRNLLLARGPDGPGWRCVGTVEGGAPSLTADEDRLYQLRRDGQIVVRPTGPAPHAWKPIGPAPPGRVLALCTVRGRLFCLTADATLWERLTDGESQPWRQFGTTPGGRQLTALGERLYCLGVRDGKPGLWSRALDGDGDWQRAGDLPVLGIPDTRLDEVRLAVWRGELLAGVMGGDQLMARPAGPEPQPWRRVGRRHPEFLKRW